MSPATFIIQIPQNMITLLLSKLIGSSEFLFSTQSEVSGNQTSIVNLGLGHTILRNWDTRTKCQWSFGLQNKIVSRCGL